MALFNFGKKKEEEKKTPACACSCGGAASEAESISSPQLDGMPRSHNPQASEERIVKGIEEIDVLKERYRQAVEYMAWFVPAWKELTEDERYVLEAFYGEDNQYEWYGEF